MSDLKEALDMLKMMVIDMQSRISVQDDRITKHQERNEGDFYKIHQEIKEIKHEQAEQAKSQVKMKEEIIKTINSLKDSLKGQIIAIQQKQNTASVIVNQFIKPVLFIVIGALVTTLISKTM